MSLPRSILTFPLLAALVLLVPSPAYPASTAPNADTEDPGKTEGQTTEGDPVGVIDGAGVREGPQCICRSEYVVAQGGRIKVIARGQTTQS